MPDIGSFILIKNEIAWVDEHLKSWLPHLDQMVFFDGNSTDGTLEVIKKYQKENEFGGKIKLVENKDPENLRDAYVEMFNECLHSLDTEYAAFLHPDMILEHPGNIRNLGESAAYFSNIRSFAGEPGGVLLEIESGRGSKWKNIYRLKNPDLGLHYYGHYGDDNEDCYFSKITGDEHKAWVNRLVKYPYPILDSGIKILHYSDVRSLERRTDRMAVCLMNGGYGREEAVKLAKMHPRVTLKDGLGFKFVSCETPSFLKEKQLA